MGCDIHPIAEVKENGVWRLNTDEVFKNPYYREDEKDKPKDEQWDWSLNQFDSTPSRSRNYDWFSILANVRNGYGFAGVPTGQGFDVIKHPNGLPDDISKEALLMFFIPISNDPELQDEEDENGKYYVSMDNAIRWGGEIIEVNGQKYVEDPDLHSANFITAEEFEKFDWNQLTMKTGVISLEQYKKFKGTNQAPDGWSGGISGGDIITISEEEADKVLNSKTDIPLTKSGDRFFTGKGEDETRPASEWSINVQYSWSVLYSEWFEHNIKDTIEPLKQLAEKYEDARMVFAFDN